jgi:Protein of unknown function (DUF3040)
MLSHEDRQRLAALERQMMIDDPAFARRLRRYTIARRFTWRRVAAAVICVLCALATVAGLLADSGALTLSSGALTLAAAWDFRRARRARR